jgi:hypothetical protein
MPKERINVVRVYDHKNKVNMGCLDKDVADTHGIELSGRRKAALHDRLAQWIG